MVGGYEKSEKLFLTLSKNKNVIFPLQSKLVND